MREKAPEVEIIRLLKGGAEYVSGQRLSEALGFSRAAVWKHIRALRKMGYSIEASPSKGYRLKGQAPFNGVEIASMLTTEFIGKAVHFFDELDSTNIKAFEHGRGGAPEGTVVVADGQTKGKGRIGRRWESPHGLNLYASIILRPQVVPQGAQGLTFVAAVAAAEAVSSFGLKPAVKWPNDILLNNRKTAGILLEMDSEPDRVHFVVVGIGVNLNISKDMMPDYIKNTATSMMAEKGAPIDRAAFTAGLLSSMERWYKVYLTQGFTPVLDEWKKYFDAQGKAVKVTFFDSQITGTCVGVDDTGALLVRKDSGEVEKVVSGDVEAVR